ncbi:Protein transport protein sec1 [Cytospora mali]|uniref:Protein transport protein sec1 n=1 Tax=Cytospora mali TaxID=578113 RepID=A0A194VVJ1_CYTMA|nr:Protein transport protein sec1 [Valsa mali]
MGISVIQIQRDVILDTLKKITKGDWKVLVVDEFSKKIIDNAVNEDDILNQNIANIERIEERRDMNPTMDAIYFVSPMAHIVDCILADMDRRRYQKSFLVWTGLLPPEMRRRLYSHPDVRNQIQDYEVLNIDFFPRESHLVTFRDPWSFPVLYHPGCNHLVREHMQTMAQKITGICISLGEYPKVRYYKPQNPLHEASVLCTHLARFVQEELDNYAKWNKEFPPPSNRPTGVLVLADRSMDLMSPLVHEFTYQAMAHDLLTIKEGDKVTYHMTVNEGQPDAEEKDMELYDKDKVWVDNRHRHMKDTIDKLMGDFQKFLDQNPNFTNEDDRKANLNTIKDMLAGLPQFQEMKEAYSLHLSMAQECMNIFQRHKLPDIASVEQTLATGLDEDFRKPKNILQEVVRLLDDDAIVRPDRLRLIMAYLIYRDGVITEDIKRLVAHAQLEQSQCDIISNLDLLGARITRGLKDVRPPPPPLFPIDKNQQLSEEYGLSRFEPNMKHMLDHLCRGSLDPISFPYVKPPSDPNEEMMAVQGSLRAAKPSWAGAGRRVPDNRQRIIVFMAGGATYSEARACYEVSERHNRDIFLATSHMVTPKMFARQVGDLSVDKRRLDLPMERPKPKAPAHLFERPAPPPMPMQPGPPVPSKGGQMGMASGQQLPARVPLPPGAGGLPGRPAPPTQHMSQMSLGGGGSPAPLRPAPPLQGHGHGSGSGSYSSPPPTGDSGKKHKAEKEKKKRNIFGIKK